MAANSYIQIQADYGSGRWVTLNRVSTSPQHISQAMKNVARIHPLKRVRAVDANGRLVDML